MDPNSKPSDGDGLRRPTRPPVELPPGMPIRENPGCGKGILVGCGGLMILLGVLSVIVMLKGGKVLEYVFTQSEQAILAQFPVEGTEADRERLSRAFEAATYALSSRDVDPSGLQPVQETLGRVIQGLESGVSLKQVRELTVALEQFAQIDPPPGAEGASE